MSSIYDALNPRQREAVLATDGPILILAGAGSGKTKALTHRIAYLMQEKGVAPWNILAITFTNKAAEEMRERVNLLVGEGAEQVWVATFHSTCARILRCNAEYLGYTPSFSIYDTAEQKQLMQQVIKKLDYDPKQYPEKAMLSRVSALKNDLVSTAEFYRRSAGNFREERIAEIYSSYQEQLRGNNAMDFDDLLVNTVRLLEQQPEILKDYQRRFHYIMVDEYQDTNMAQFRLVELLAREHHNLCVVGDDDQSIYKFRGADIRIIRSFTKSFPGAQVIMLEQNYRSTGNILDKANQLIQKNEGRSNKTLWTENEEGKPVLFYQYDNAYAEADAIIRHIREGRRPWGDHAILYRTNAQSRILEEKFVSAGIPYRLLGGVNFYQRKEIKDMIGYLKTIANGQDDIAVQRIINVPRRGIGETTISRIMAYADDQGISFYDAIAEWKKIPGLNRAGASLAGFWHQMQGLKSKSEEMTVRELLENILVDTGYQEDLLKENTPEALARWENIQELVSKAADFGDDPEDVTALERFLEEIALVAEIDNLDAEEERVVLMTLHSAKGLEFPRVYMVGMEEGLFPGYLSINSEDPTDLEEERRLCYVGVTRAKKELILTAARERMINGERRYGKTSRFVDEMHLEDEKRKVLAERAEQRVYSSSTTNYRGASYRPRVSGFSGSSNAYLSKPESHKTVDAPLYAVGDYVRHPKFGEGLVKNMEKGKRDYEVTVEFDRVGTKTVFASFARLEKI